MRRNPIIASDSFAADFVNLLALRPLHRERKQPMTETYQAALHAQIEDLSVGDRMGAAEALLAEVRRQYVSSLPEFPADGVCECGNGGTEFGSWQHIEYGYTRWTSGEFDEDHLHLSTDGWDDMSESGEVEWVECNLYRAGRPGCGKAYRMPDNVEWD